MTFSGWDAVKGGDAMFMPVMIQLDGREAAVIGAGNVALSKVETLLGFGAKVKVIAPEISDGFEGLEGSIEIVKEPYDKRHIAGCFMVIAASSSEEANKQALMDCREMGIICCRSDRQQGSDFIFPSMLKRGSLVLSVSTQGKSPALCGVIMRELENTYGEDYEEKLELLWRLRDLLRLSEKDQEQRAKLLRKAAVMGNEEIARMVREYED